MKKKEKRTEETVVSKARRSGTRLLTTAQGRITLRAGALFKALSTDYLLRQQFVTDPARIMSEYIFGEHPEAETLDIANQMLYSVLSNRRLRNWLMAYSTFLRGGLPARRAFAVGFARAVATSGDRLTALALIRSASVGENNFELQADLLRSIVAILGLRFGDDGTEMSPGQTGTEVSPGQTGTEISPGDIFEGTEMSPGGGTEVSPGTGTEISPGQIFEGTEMSPGGGTEVSPGTGTEISPGQIFDGTEMSPGGGTEVSPGTGTEISPGSGIVVLPGYLQVTLVELVAYAEQLRAGGALSLSGLVG